MNSRRNTTSRITVCSVRYHRNTATRITVCSVLYHRNTATQITACSVLYHRNTVTQITVCSVRYHRNTASQITVCSVRCHRNTASQITVCSVRCHRNTALQITVCSVLYHKNKASCSMSDVSPGNSLCYRPTCWCVNVCSSSERCNKLDLVCCANRSLRHYTDRVMSTVVTSQPLSSFQKLRPLMSKFVPCPSIQWYLQNLRKRMLDSSFLSFRSCGPPSNNSDPT